MMNTRKESHIQRQVVLRNTPVWAKPRSQQRPTAFHRLHVHFMNAIALLIASLCTTAMTDALVRVTPRCYTAVAIVGSRLDTRTPCSRGVAQRLDRDWWDVFHPPHDDVTTALDHPDDRRCLGGERSAATCALEPSAPAAPPLFTTSCGLPW
jgi:hypothetical protein